MAGTGFELRRLLRRGSYAGLIRAYAYAGAISSGPWLLSILSILAIGFLGRGTGRPDHEIEQFQVTVTWAIAASLVLTGGLQLSLSRFCADRLFEKRPDRIGPNLLGALAATSVTSGAVGLAIVLALFPGTPSLRALLVTTFVALCDVWIVVVVLSSLKAYRTVLAAFAIAYGLTLAVALALRRFGLEGLLLGFVVGQTVMLFALLGAALRQYPSLGGPSFDFLRRGGRYLDLIATGVLYNLAIWADKLVFWCAPSTSEPVIGPLRASSIYDAPIFLAYLSIVPGMGVFLVRIETDFAEQYEAFFAAVRGGRTLDQIAHHRNRMVEAVRQGIYEILKVQGLTLTLLLVVGRELLLSLDLSLAYLPLFHIDLAAASLQVLVLAILNVFCYLDCRREVLALSAFLLASNTGLSILTQHLGPSTYGYGFAVAALLNAALGFTILGRRLDRLEFATFMSQRLA